MNKISSKPNGDLNGMTIPELLKRLHDAERFNTEAAERLFEAVARYERAEQELYDLRRAVGVKPRHDNDTQARR